MFLKTVRPAMVAVTIWLFAASISADEFADGIAAFDRGDFSAAHRLLMSLAEQGDPRAAIIVAGDFYVGWGVVANDARAEEWRLRAKSVASPTDFDLVTSRWRAMATAGDAAAQAMLGAAYYAAFGVPMDPTEALKWIRAAADQGHVRGQYALGELYFAGDGVPRDVAEAIKWFSLAAEQGDASAQLKLGMLTEKGLVPGADAVSAAAWYQRAAEQGNVEAQYRLDDAYRDGRRAPGDDSQALERSRIAAAGGNTLAQMRLGEIYLRGDVVAQDAVEAYQWLVLASASQARLPPRRQQELQALLGWAEVLLTDSQERAALHSLGVKCRDGSGVPQDDVLAQRFMDMAAAGATNTSLSGQVHSATAPAVSTIGDDCLFVTVRPSLRKAVQVAAETSQPPLVIRFEGDRGAELCERSVELTFSLTVDRTSQSKNWEDTARAGNWGDPPGPDKEAIVIGSMLPWPCPTTHALLAVARNRAGEQLDTFEARKLERRMGTMLRCTDESGPSDSIATGLILEVLRKMRESTTAPAGVGRP